MFRMVSQFRGAAFASSVFVVVASGMFAGPAHAEEAPTPPRAATDAASAETDRSDRRIQRLHEELHVTAAQEALWAPVVKVMHDNALALYEKRPNDERKLTAVEDLKWFQIVADEHSAGLRRFIPVFEALYSGMSPEQKSRADRLFRNHRREPRM